jgi:ribosomal protein S18 acetylase RimI-like enzyme
VLELRTFQDDDNDVVWALHDHALQDAGAHGGHGPWEDDLRDIHGTYLEPGGEFLVGFADGELVCMGGLLRHSEGECEIKRMRVRPDRQRQGIGHHLLEELERRARGRGFVKVRLDTTDGQTAARRLYKSAGYREVGRRETARFVFVDFVKELDPS